MDLLHLRVGFSLKLSSEQGQSLRITLGGAVALRAVRRCRHPCIRALCFPERDPSSQPVCDTKSPSPTIRIAYGSFSFRTISLPSVTSPLPIPHLRSFPITPISTQ